MITFTIGEIEIDFKSEGVRSAFKSDSMRDALQERCDAIANAACDASSPDTMDKPPFMGDVEVGNNTCVGFVTTVTPHGYNAKERIIDNIGAGGA